VPFAHILIRKEPFYRRAAFETGLKKLGYTLSSLTQPKDKRDLLVLWNLKAGAEESMARLWEQRGGTVIVAENAYLQKVDKSIYAISTHGHNGSGWFPVGDEDRFTPLGFPIKPWPDSAAEDSDDRYLVCAQRSIGSREMASPPQWAEKKVAELVRKGWKARLRPHPGNSAPKIPIERDLTGIDVCWIWSSGAGVRVLVEGVRVHHAAPHWICADWYKTGRENVLNHMAHGQWRHEEIATGEPFARMAAADWGPRW
jgi:hypothetical protein